MLDVCLVQRISDSVSGVDLLLVCSGSVDYANNDSEGDDHGLEKRRGEARRGERETHRQTTERPKNG